MSPNAVVWLLSFVCFSLGCSQQFVLGIPNMVAEDCGVTLSDIGLFMSTFGFANALGTPVVLALMGGRVTPRNQLLIGLALMLGGLLVVWATSFYPVLLFARVFMGIGHGIICANAYSAAVAISRPDRKATAMANVAMGFSLAMVLAMPIARVATRFVSWHALYGILAVIAVGFAFAIVREVPADLKTGDASGLRALLSPLKSPVVVLAIVGIFFSQVGYMGFYTYITPYLEGIVGDHDLVSAVLFGVGLMCVVGSKGSGFAGDHIGIGKTLVGGMALQLMLYVCMLLVSGSAVAVVVTVALWCAAAWTLVPAQNVLLTKNAPDSPSVAIALSNACLHSGGAVGSTIAGAAINAFPLTYLPLLGVVCIAVAIVFSSLAVTRAREWGAPGKR